MSEAGPGFLRRALRRLPGPVRRAGRRLLQLGLHRRRPISPPLPAFPDDVADETAVREFLADNAAIFGSEAEADGYLDDALTRFRVTMALLPPLPAGARVLELGANPYFITRLLRRRGLDVTCANWFGSGHYSSGRGRDEIPGEDGAEVFEFDHFNVEEDGFPYRASSFDVVFFCEILEHLPFDPVHALAEIHRVLKPGGILMVTTPNAVRGDRLAAILRGENVYEPLSGYGAYGRHNRVYTADELERLLTALGYQVDTLLALDVHRSETIQVWPRHADIRSRGDNLFGVARPLGDPRWRYPRWLFQSVHAFYGKRIVRPDLKVGHNDDLQSSGLAEPDEADPGVRWTAGREVRIILAPELSGQAEIVVEGVRSTAAGEVRLKLSWANEDIELCVPEGQTDFRVSAPAPATRGRTEVALHVVGPEVGVRRIALEPAGRSRRPGRRPGRRPRTT